MNNPEDLLKEYKGLKGEREQYVTQEPMSMEELDLASQVATEEPVSGLGMEEADRLDNMLKEYKQTPEWLREADQEREALQAQQDVDDLDFGTAFDTHYEQYKEYVYPEAPHPVEPALLRADQNQTDIE